MQITFTNSSLQELNFRSGEHCFQSVWMVAEYYFKVLLSGVQTSLLSNRKLAVLSKQRTRNTDLNKYTKTKGWGNSQSKNYQLQPTDPMNFMLKFSARKWGNSATLRNFENIVTDRQIVHSIVKLGQSLGKVRSYQKPTLVTRMRVGFFVKV